MGAFAVSVVSLTAFGALSPGALLCIVWISVVLVVALRTSTAVTGSTLVAGSSAVIVASADGVALSGGIVAALVSWMLIVWQPSGIPRIALVVVIGGAGAHALLSSTLSVDPRLGSSALPIGGLLVLGVVLAVITGVRHPPSVPLRRVRRLARTSTSVAARSAAGVVAGVVVVVELSVLVAVDVAGFVDVLTVGVAAIALFCSARHSDVRVVPLGPRLGSAMLVVGSAAVYAVAVLPLLRLASATLIARWLGLAVLLLAVAWSRTDGEHRDVRAAAIAVAPALPTALFVTSRFAGAGHGNPGLPALAAAGLRTEALVEGALGFLVLPSAWVVLALVAFLRTQTRSSTLQLVVFAAGLAALAGSDLTLSLGVAAIVGCVARRDAVGPLLTLGAAVSLGYETVDIGSAVVIVAAAVLMAEHVRLARPREIRRVGLPAHTARVVTLSAASLALLAIGNLPAFNPGLAFGDALFRLADADPLLEALEVGAACFAISTLILRRVTLPHVPTGSNP